MKTQQAVLPSTKFVRRTLTIALSGAVLTGVMTLSATASTSRPDNRSSETTQSAPGYTCPNTTVKSPNKKVKARIESYVTTSGRVNLEITESMVSGEKRRFEMFSNHGHHRVSKKKVRRFSGPWYNLEGGWGFSGGPVNTGKKYTWHWSCLFIMATTQAAAVMPSSYSLPTSVAIAGKTVEKTEQSRNGKLRIDTVSKKTDCGKRIGFNAHDRFWQKRRFVVDRKRVNAHGDVLSRSTRVVVGLQAGGVIRCLKPGQRELVYVGMKKAGKPHTPIARAAIVRRG